MDIEHIERLVDIVTRANVSEVTVRANGYRITVRNGRSAGRCRDGSCTTGTTVGGDLEARVGFAGQPAEHDDVGEPKITITAPLVGIFHATAPPVERGTTVTPDMIVGMIESMKLMNDVRAETTGTVADVMVEDGMPVEFGHALFTLTRADA